MVCFPVHRLADSPLPAQLIEFPHSLIGCFLFADWPMVVCFLFTDWLISSSLIGCFLFSILADGGVFPVYRLADCTFPCALMGLFVARFQAYLYRKIFEEFFPTPAAAETVPAGPSIACSTARAIEWDDSFKAREGGVSYF